VWVGHLGSDYIAAVMASVMALWLGFAGALGLAAGARALVARMVGAGDIEGANDIARQALFAAGIYGLCMALVFSFLAGPILRLIGLDAAVVVKGEAYLRIYAFSAIPSCIWIVMEAMMQASGDVIRPLLMTVSSKIVHVAIEPLFIFGWAFFPSLGIHGAALTVVATESIGMAAGLWIVVTGRTRLRPVLNRTRFSARTVWRIVKIGVPAALLNAQGSLAGLVFMRAISPFGTSAVSAYSLCMRIEGLVTMPTAGMSLAAAVLVGQNLGAKQPERAEKGAWFAMALVEGFTVVVAGAIVIFAEQISGLFNADPGLVAIASTFLRIAAGGYLAVGVSTVLQNCFNGAGDTLPPTVVTLVVTWAIQVPLAFLLPGVADLGAYGVRWGILAGWVAAAAFNFVYFRLGRWKRKKI
jgi:putative MATE family efflux protein